MWWLGKLELVLGKMSQSLYRMDPWSSEKGSLGLFLPLLRAHLWDGASKDQLYQPSANQSHFPPGLPGPPQALTCPDSRPKWL